MYASEAFNALTQVKYPGAHPQALRSRAAANPVVIMGCGID
jgi:hypothetical protein